VRKSKETVWLSPTANPKVLCSFTGLARGLTCALGLADDLAFTAEDFKSVTREFNGVGQHTGVVDVDEAGLNALLTRKGISLQRFKAAMFGNVLTPARFQQLRSDLDEVERLKGSGAKRRAEAMAEGEEEDEAERPKPARARAARARAPSAPDAIDVPPKMAPPELTERPRRGSGSRRVAVESPAAGASPRGMEDKEEAMEPDLSSLSTLLSSGLREIGGIISVLEANEKTMDKKMKQVRAEGVAALRGDVVPLTRGLGLDVAHTSKLHLAPSWDPSHTAALKAILPAATGAPLMEAPSADALLYTRAAGPLGSQPSMPPGWNLPLVSETAPAAALEAAPGPLFRSLSGSLSSGAANKRLSIVHRFVAAHASPELSEAAINDAGFSLETSDILQLCDELPFLNLDSATGMSETDEKNYGDLLRRLELPW
jgi:hypothetical protein